MRIFDWEDWARQMGEPLPDLTPDTARDAALPSYQPGRCDPLAAASAMAQVGVLTPVAARAISYFSESGRALCGWDGATGRGWVWYRGRTYTPAAFNAVWASDTPADTSGGSNGDGDTDDADSLAWLDEPFDDTYLYLTGIPQAAASVAPVAATVSDLPAHVVARRDWRDTLVGLTLLAGAPVCAAWLAGWAIVAGLALLAQLLASGLLSLWP